MDQTEKKHTTTSSTVTSQSQGITHFRQQQTENSRTNTLESVWTQRAAVSSLTCSLRPVLLLPILPGYSSFGSYCRTLLIFSAPHTRTKCLHKRTFNTCTTTQDDTDLRHQEVPEGPLENTQQVVPSGSSPTCHHPAQKGCCDRLIQLH